MLTTYTQTQELRHRQTLTQTNTHTDKHTQTNTGTDTNSNTDTHAPTDIYRYTLTHARVPGACCPGAHTCITSVRVTFWELKHS